MSHLSYGAAVATSCTADERGYNNNTIIFWVFTLGDGALLSPHQLSQILQPRLRGSIVKVHLGLVLGEGPPQAAAVENRTVLVSVTTDTGYWPMSDFTLIVELGEALLHPPDELPRYCSTSWVAHLPFRETLIQKTT